MHLLASASYADGRAEARAIEALGWLRSFDVNVDDVNPKTGLTPLHRAVMSDNRSFALALIDQGACVTLSTAKERRTPPDLARDDGFRQEILARGTAASRVTAPAAPPPQVAAAGPVHRVIATPDASLASLAEAARGAFNAAAASAVPFHSAPLAADDGEAVRTLSSSAAIPTLLSDAAPSPKEDIDDEQRRLRRRLVVPEPSAAIALRDAWWRARERFPPAPAPMPRTDAVVSLAYRGIPAELRADVWIAAAGVPAVMCGQLILPPPSLSALPCRIPARTRSGNPLRLTRSQPSVCVRRRRAAMEARGVSYKRLIGVSGSHLSKECIIQIEKDVRRSGLSLDDESGAPAALYRRAERRPGHDTFCSTHSARSAGEAPDATADATRFASRALLRQVTCKHNRRMDFTAPGFRPRPGCVHLRSAATGKL